MFVNCTLCLPHEWMFAFIFYSILLDEEGHIKITGMWGMENLISTSLFFFCSMLRASRSLLGKSLLSKTQKPKVFQCWASLLWQLVKHMCCTAQGEHSVFLVKSCTLNWCEAFRFGCLPLWMEGCFQYDCLLQITFSELKLCSRHLERHSFAILEVLSGHPFHCCPSGIIIPNLWLSEQESLSALSSTNLNCVFPLI